MNLFKSTNMKSPNYEDTEGKHPIPHAKGIAKGENAKEGEKKDKSTKKNSKDEEE